MDFFLFLGIVIDLMFGVVLYVCVYVLFNVFVAFARVSFVVVCSSGICFYFCVYVFVIVFDVLCVLCVLCFCCVLFVGV